MPDKNDFRNNPRSYVLELIDDGQLSYEQFAQMAVSALGGDKIQEMLEANNLAPKECDNCEVFVGDDDELCDECQLESDKESFIGNIDPDEYDIDRLKGDIEQDNFDIELDDVEDYSKIKIVQRSLLNGQRKQAEELCCEYGLNFVEQVVEFDE